jgi:GT2 family glycosyltransferase
MPPERIALPILSVIIVAYKSRDEIGLNLDSLPRKLADRDIEVILVDNYPADGTTGFVRENYPWVNCIDPGANVGFGRANNLGYAASRGEHILFLNPDTVLNAFALEHCLTRLQADAAIGFISPRLVLANGTIDQACRRGIPTIWDGFCRASGLARVFPQTGIFSGYNLTHLPVNGTYAVGAINGAFMLARREVLKKMCADDLVFDEKFFMYGDDLDLCIRTTRAGYKVVYDGRVEIIHFKGKSVAKEWETMSQAIFDANRDVYLKHFGQSSFSRLKYGIAFGAWKIIATLRAKLRGHRRVQPL